MAGLFERHNRQMNDMMKQLDEDAPGAAARARARQGSGTTAGEPLSRPKITPGADQTYDATRRKK